MNEPAKGDELVVPTPERVTFQYEVAGIGSRFLAQAIDSLILAGLIIALAVVAGFTGGTLGMGEVGGLIFIIVGFLIVFGYFPILEKLTSGMTFGKRALKIRVVGDRGEPVTFTQVGIRNLLRMVDFLPFFYGVGLVTLFAQGRGKRLGDMAAGTLVVKDRARVKLQQLVERAAAPPTPMTARRSIWADGRDASAVAEAPRRDPYAESVGRLTPGMRRFIEGYVRRRSGLNTLHRQRLAERVQGPLTELLPKEVAGAGVLAVLDGVADALLTAQESTT